jgi:hypothetical protein
MIIGLAATLPQALSAGLRQHGLSASVATSIGNQPPVSSLFAAFLGYNPVGTILGSLPASSTQGADIATLTNKQFFPSTIAGPFHHGLVIVFSVAIAMSLVAALASLARGRRYVHDDGADNTDIADTTHSAHGPLAANGTRSSYIADDPDDEIVVTPVDVSLID